MIFNTIEYFLMFLVPAAIMFRLVRPAAQPWVCLGFGAGFFIFFSFTQIGGAAGAACLLIFLWEALFSRLYRPGHWLCLVGIVQALALLMIFKYWNFFTGLCFSRAGHNPLYWSGAFLPLGISFFTFEFIHYGLTRILAGLAKKFLIADLLTAFTQHLCRNDIAQAQRWVLPLWLLAFGGQIYFDFSAYSDIAIGSARLFGIKVPENFDWPYIRTNIAEFWRHWHISLYRWLVDYVFIPLGGSRVRPSRVYTNLLITMFLSGLWHGAGLNFILWGLWHGMLLSVHRLWSRWRGADAAPPTRTAQAFGWATTFVAVNLGWAFFAMDLPTSIFYFHRLLLG